jgi:hypothetical protein
MIGWSAKTVCQAVEYVPMMDFLDMVYTPENKELWLRNYEALGLNWVTRCKPQLLQVRLDVQGSPGDELRPVHYSRAFQYGRDHADKAINIPMFNTTNTPTIFAPIKNYSDETYRADLFSKYGRHIVRCAREYYAGQLARTALGELCQRAECARELKYYFPELIEWMDEDKDSTEYFRKTKRDKFASKYRPTGASRFTADGKWEQYKQIIISLVTRAKLINNIERTPDPNEQLPYDAPIEKWMVKLMFNP